MIKECKPCKGSGRIRTERDPERNISYLDYQCIECHGTGTIAVQERDDTAFAKAARPIYQRASAAAEAQEDAALAVALELMADLASAGFMISEPQEASLRAAAKALLRKAS